MKVLCILLALSITHTLNACDICGGGLQMEGANGVIPFYTQTQLSMRYVKVDLHHPFNSTSSANRIISDRLSKAELGARFYPNKKWQIVATVPYVMNLRVKEQQNNVLNQVGDLNLQVNRFILNTNDSVKRKTRIIWLAGGGIVLPTGKYQQRDETKLMLPIGLQAGLGAYQFKVSNQYTMRYGSWGFGNYATFTCPQTNELNYQTGNSFINSSLVFKVISKNNWSLVPQTGFSFFTKKKDKRYDAYVSYTSSTLGSAVVGLDCYYKNYLIQMGMSLPVLQDIELNQPEQRNSLSVGISYFITK